MPCRCSSQLSYSPIELVIIGKVNARSLTVFRRLEPELDRALADEQRLGQKVATVERSAVDREQVNLAAFVPGPDVAPWGAAVRLDTYGDDTSLAVEPAPLALHPPQQIADFEDQVRASVLTDGLEDRNACFDGRQGDRGLGHVALVIRIVHEHMFP
jgi:hypothetical protein